MCRLPMLPHNFVFGHSIYLQFGLVCTEFCSKSITGFVSKWSPEFSWWDRRSGLCSWAGPVLSNVLSIWCQRRSAPLVNASGLGRRDVMRSSGQFSMSVASGRSRDNFRSSESVIASRRKSGDRYSTALVAGIEGVDRRVLVMMRTVVCTCSWASIIVDRILPRWATIFRVHECKSWGSQCACVYTPRSACQHSYDIIPRGDMRKLHHDDIIIYINYYELYNLHKLLIARENKTDQHVKTICYANCKVHVSTF